MRFVVAITGASGIIYGKRLLEVLKGKAEVHLIISKTGEQLLKHELKMIKDELNSFVDFVHSEANMLSPLASGSFQVDAMIIIPCSMKTIAGIASGYSENLILRTADVVLKERHKLILVPRETPLSSLHLDNLLNLSRQGAIILPAMPAFYHKPTKIDDLVDFIIGKVLDSLGVDHTLFPRWTGS